MSTPPPQVVMEDPGTKLRVGVIGVGALGRHHARLLAGLPEAELVGVADPNAAQGLEVAQACGCQWFSDYGLLLDQRLDAVSIVVPTIHHRRIAEACLQRGVPVLVEKPITPTLADGEALCDAAESRGLALQVGHIERFNPAFQALRDRTRAPKYIRAERLAPYSFRSTDVSVVHDLMIHDLDLARTLTPAPVASVQAFGICVFGGYSDVVQARITFTDGCIADFVASRVNPFVRRSLQVWSEAGCWTADLQEQSLTGYECGPRLLRGDRPQSLATAPGADIDALKGELFESFLTVQKPVIARQNALQEELRSFLQAVRGELKPVVDGRAGLAALALTEQVVASVANHAWDGVNGRRGPDIVLDRPLQRAA